MLAVTHAAIAATAVSFSLGSVDPGLMVLAVLGSQLPDIDTSESLVGQVAFPVSRAIEARYAHRTITHSFVATGAIALVASPLWLIWSWKYWLALWVGHLVACFSDTFTKKGVQLFWPQPVWCVCGANPKRRMRTGGAGEYWVLGVAMLLLLLNLKLTSAGGILKQTSEAFDLRPNLVATYNQNAATAHVWAEVKGIWASDRTRADGRYFILANRGSEFVVSDGREVYQTGKQILVEKLKVQPGDRASLQVLTARMEDEPGEVLSQLRQMDAAVFLSGSLRVDEPEALQVWSSPKALATMTAGGAGVTLDYAPLEDAIAALSDQYASGSLTVQIITPSPWE